MQIKHLPKPFQIDVKRLHLPIQVEDECPKCGMMADLDLSGPEYLSYPHANVPETLSFYCHDCEKEWSRSVVISVRMEPA